MASLDDQSNKLKDQLAKEKESREATEARAEAEDEARADEQRKQHEALLKILSQLQSPSGHEEAKNQDTPVQEAPATSDDGEMLPSNDGGSVVPAEAETEWDLLGGRGQARDFAPIVELSSNTHSGRGVKMKITPPVLKDRKGFPAFREQVKVYAKFNCFESVLTTESPVDVGSEERDELLRRGVSSVTYDRHLRAWAFFSMAFELPTDIGRFRRSTSPRQFWENTVNWYIPQTAGQQVTLRQQLTNFQVPKTSDPVQKLLEIEDHAELMRDAGIKVDGQVVYGAYVATLPSPEYQPEIRELKREQVFDREHIICLVRAAHELLKDKRRICRQPLRSLVMDAMGAVGEDTPEPSEGVEVVEVDAVKAATERLNPATTTKRMLLRTARSLPKVRCATTAMLEVTSLPTAKLRYARSTVEGDTTRASVRPQRTWRLPLRWSCRVLIINLRLRASGRQDSWQKRWMRCVSILKPMWHKASAIVLILFQPVV